PGIRRRSPPPWPARGSLDRPASPADAREDAEAKAATMKQQVERDVEQRGAELERQMHSAKDDFERRSAEMNAAVQRTVESRVKEATASIESRMREMQEGVERERAGVQGRIDELGALAARSRPELVPATTPGGHVDIDMAERFFGRSGWRAAPGVPLAILGSMFAAGVVATGVALFRRDGGGR
ncbi:MAG: hypothetical protein ACKOTB_15570, partial [Planctomycetia bacterium]